MLFYGLLGVGAAKLFEKAKTDNVLVAVLAILVAYLLRDGYLFGFQIAYSRTIFPLGMFIKFSCFSAMLTAVLGFGWFFIMGKLHGLRSMRKKLELDFHLSDYDQPKEWR